MFQEVSEFGPLERAPFFIPKKLAEAIGFPMELLVEAIGFPMAVGATAGAAFGPEKANMPLGHRWRLT